VWETTTPVVSPIEHRVPYSAAQPDLGLSIRLTAQAPIDSDLTPVAQRLRKELSVKSNIPPAHGCMIHKKKTPTCLRS